MAESPQITVIGQGIGTGSPDQCVVLAALNVMAETVPEAVSRVAALASQVSDSLKSEGVDPQDLRTTNLHVQDFFDRAKSRVTARTARYQIALTVRHLDQLGQRLATIVRIAGDSLQIQTLQLAVSDDEPLRRESRLSAMNDARRKATELAAAAGLNLGRILSIEENAGIPGPPVRAVAASAMKMSGGGAPIESLPVEPGSLSVTSRVAVTYELS